MLGRLIQTATSYGRGNNTLESATEESHTRNLLYGQSHHIVSLAQSPPTSPYATPVFRPGSFDDRGGLELEERDIRVLIAQDAFGADERPTLLFDSLPQSPTSATLPSHGRHASMTGPRIPLPNDWKPPTQTTTHTPNDGPFRSRSTTLAGAPASWARPVRDLGTREESYLECMFGVTSSTKTSSTTKMHILPGKPRSGPRTEVRSRYGPEGDDQQSRRTPLQRSRTSNTVMKSPYHPSLSSVDTEAQSHDSVLITRLFSVAIAEPVAQTLRSTSIPSSPNADTEPESSPMSPLLTTRTQAPKKPKLVERKVPAFAIGVIITLPRVSDFHMIPSQARPASRSAHTHNLSSTSSSYGSDMQGSWTFLNAIPESLASTRSSLEEFDKRLDTVVINEDVILRAVALLEIESIRVIHKQLQKILDNIVSPGPKAPKEKAMQRINQQIISISDPTAVAKNLSLQEAAKQMIRRMVYALRIPRVVTGLGFGAGHWSDEARAAFRVCGRRQQNFFLYTLLTAFLGHNTQWLERLAPEWYRKQHRLSTKQHVEQHALCNRTIIVSDQRALARRLIFLLASFIPGVPGMDGLQKPGEELSVATLSMSSPSSHVVRNESLRRTANRRMRESRLYSNSNDRALLSTSADSVDSTMTAEQARRFLTRHDSDAMSLKGPSILSVPDGEGGRKMGANTTSALISHPTTPVAVFSTKKGIDADSYFPPFAETHDSVASAGLASILRRSSSSFGNSSNVSSRWGSLVSGLSEIWTSKPSGSGEPGSMTTHSPSIGSPERRSTEVSTRKSKPNALQEMVNQLDTSRSAYTKSLEIRFADHDQVLSTEFASPPKHAASMPRLKVDEQDGVVDVDLDLPGFTNFDPGDLFKSPPRSAGRPSGVHKRDAAESIRSLRSVPTNPTGNSVAVDANVAGFLKRHHEDFSLYAVRSYPELEEEVKRSMLAEPLPPMLHDCSPAMKIEDMWIPVCSTVIADMKNFSVRKLTLKRKFDRDVHQATCDGSPVAATASASKPSNKDVTEHAFIDEEIKDFDTTLADAIEKVLDIGDIVQGSLMTSPRSGHKRTASSSTMKSTPPSLPSLGVSNYTGVSRDYVRQDCRQLVLGALESIVKDVCDDLSKLEKGRDIHGGRSFDASDIKEEMKQENVLREGVKCWLLDLEQPKVY